MTKLEIFEKVESHLLRQGKRSVYVIKDTERYAYRGNNGTQCAIGCLIKDEFYLPILEGLIVYDSRVVDAVERSIGRKLERDEVDMLEFLQGIHDCNEVNEWKEKLEALKRELFR